ncbi:ribonuclease H [Reticulomyxa filosa]|uniref:Ribonuclease H n=1 Tax=Reticulomyxa filosa TaxID=46433 RepID=X6LJ14_RETFI|nr:ribonuclease H [Reticulomyxa filosa]|eukprot:ETO00710.1 ribonuclease H [Reticulomyxa filosa]
MCLFYNILPLCQFNKLHSFHLKKKNILSDCKFAVNAIHNKCNSEIYNYPIAERLGENEVPEIYWIKGHSGIPENERVDIVAKRVRFKAEVDQPELFRRPDRTAPECPWIESILWNRHWIFEATQASKTIPDQFD